MKIDVWIPISNGAEEGDRFVVRGISISEEPNNLDMVMDYDTSKPYMIESAAAFEARTAGSSKGSLRIMHTAQVAGKIVEMDFDDEAKTIPVAAEVVNEEARKMVEERAYTGFSWGGRTVGNPWLDNDLTAKHGRPIHRYTFRPVELSLVDAPRVPGTHFTSVENADIEEEEMENAEAPVETAPVEAPATEGEKVENGVYTAGRLMECLESLTYLQKVIEAEEGKEGDSAEIPAELKAGLQSLAPAVAKYAAAQVAELVGGQDLDLLIGEDDSFDDIEDAAENGDISGDEIENGTAMGDSGKATKGAYRATVRAFATGKPAAHKTAAQAHKTAAKVHNGAGGKKMAAFHKGMFKAHAANCNAVENGDTASVENGTVDPMAGLLQRLEALEAKASAPIENGDKPEAIHVPAPVLVTITKDEENQAIANGDSPVRLAAAKIAAMPEHERSKAMIQYQLSGQI